MAATTFDDPVFGTLTWDAMDRVWVGAVAVPYFRGFGENLPPYPRLGEADEDDPEVQEIMNDVNELFRQTRTALAGVRGMEETAEMFDSIEEGDALDPDELFAKGRFKVALVGGGLKKPPTPAQHDAWARLTKARGASFNEVIDRLLEGYRRQRPLRLRWWETTYGDSPDHVLPDARTAKDLATIVRPLEFRVYASGDVGIHFDASWNRMDLGVRVSPGGLVEIGDKEVALDRPPAGKIIDHPILGNLRRDENCWAGTTRFEPFRGFLEISYARHQFENEPPEQIVRHAPPWDFIEGDFPLTINDEKGSGPATAQASAYEALMADQDRVAPAVHDAILKYYQKRSKGYRQDLGELADALMPRLTSAEGLRHLLTFQGLTVFEREKSRGRAKPIAIGLTFSCTWDEEHGLGVRWRDGKVEAVGQADEAFG